MRWESRAPTFEWIVARDLRAQLFLHAGETRYPLIRRTSRRCARGVSHGSRRVRVYDARASYVERFEKSRLPMEFRRWKSDF